MSPWFFPRIGDIPGNLFRTGVQVLFAERKVHDIIVIGAGPAGSSAAWTAADGGFKVALIDPQPPRRRRPQCGEVISRRALEYSGLEEEGIVVHEMDLYRIISPSGDMLSVRYPALSIDRSRFEEELIKRSIDLGADMRYGEAVNQAKFSRSHWVLRTRRGEYRTRSVILASGAVSPLNRLLGLGSNLELMMGLGARITGRDTGKHMDFFVSADMEGGYGWHFPRGHETNIGVCSRGNIRFLLNRLIRHLKISGSDLRSFFGGPIPDGGPINPLVGHCCVAVGDAGGFCHPVSKGGVYCSMISGVEAAKAIMSQLSGDEYALVRFDKDIREHPAFSISNIRWRDMLSSLPDGALDTITGITQGRDFLQMGRKGLMLGAIRHPELLSYLKEAGPLFSGGFRWLDYTF